jgi:hypothetical protein
MQAKEPKQDFYELYRELQDEATKKYRQQKKTSNVSNITCEIEDYRNKLI